MVELWLQSALFLFVVFMFTGVFWLSNEQRDLIPYAVCWTLASALASALWAVVVPALMLACISWVFREIRKW